MPARSGVLAAGNFVVDRLIVVDRYPPENTLATIEAETVASGGCPYSVLKDLALLGSAFPLAALGALGVDSNAQWVRADLARHAIDTTRMVNIADAATSQTYVMMVRQTGRRTFFHQRGANALLAPQHFDFTTTAARVFVLGYLTLLDTLDRWNEPGKTGAALVLERARSAGLVTIVDLVSAPHEQYREMVRSALPAIDHLVINEWEAAAALGRPVPPTPAEMLDAARELGAGGVNDSVVIHCEDGVVAFDCRTGKRSVQPTVALPPNLVVGATGAGDAFTAGYVYSLHSGETPAQRLRAGVCCAAAALRDASASGGIEAMEACLELGPRFGYRAFSPP